MQYAAKLAKHKLCSEVYLTTYRRPIADTDGERKIPIGDCDAILCPHQAGSEGDNITLSVVSIYFFGVAAALNVCLPSQT